MLQDIDVDDIDVGDILMLTILMLTILMLTILMLTILMLTISKMLTTRTVWNGWRVLQDIARYCVSASWQLGPRRRKAARQKGNMISRFDRR